MGLGVKLNEDGRVECLICHQWQPSVRSLSIHVSKGHCMDRVAYYDRYVKGAGEGICANPECGKPTNFITLSEGYAECCCKSCFGKVSSADGRARRRIAKAAETNMKKFGVPNVFQSDECKMKSRETNLARHGVEYASQSAVVQEKCKDTCRIRYGSSTYLHSEEGEAAVRKINLERYGVENGGGSVQAKVKAAMTNENRYGSSNPWDNAEYRSEQLARDRERNGGQLYIETDEFKRKSVQTQQERYGGCAVSTPEIRAKITSTNMERYGTEQYFASNDFKEKAVRTNMLKYGVENYAQTDEYHAKVSATNIARYGSASYAGSPVYLERAMRRYMEPLKKFGCTVVSFASKAQITYRCERCGHESCENSLFIVWRVRNGYTPCTGCLAKTGEISLEESSLGDFIGTLGLSYAHYGRDFLGKYGADMVFEDRKVIIEYDGVYWQSELFRDSGYHLQKTILAEERGYHLVHIFSDEWMYKRDIVKARLKNLLAPDSLVGIYARTCEVREVGKQDSDEFLDTNHIQGACMDSTRLGLYSEDKLVALMTFGPNRFGEGHELIRYCTLGGYRVVGAAGKLFKHYIKMHPDVSSIITYADRRWTKASGAFYDKIGFVYDGESDPGYYYVNGDMRESRMKYQKHKLVADGADSTLSEHEIMLERGIYRIYDCGNLRYRWNRQNLL